MNNALWKTKNRGNLKELDLAWLETGGCVPEFEEGADSFLGIPVDRDQ